MIPAQKKQTSESILTRYNRLLIRRFFSKVRIKCPAGLDLSIPTLYACNHHNWWDLYLAFYINEHRLGQDAAYLVERNEFDRLVLHKRANVIPVQVDSYQAMRQALDAGIEWLDRPNASLWAFSQREAVPDGRPLRFFPGLGSILEKIRHIQVIPVAFHYTFEWDPRPSAYIQFGMPLVPSAFEKGNRRNWVAACEKELSFQLDELRMRVNHGHVEGFELASSGFKRTDEWMAELENAAKPMLDWLQKKKKGRRDDE